MYNQAGVKHLFLCHSDIIKEFLTPQDDYEFSYIPSEDSGIDLISESNVPSPVEEVNPDIDLIIAASSTPIEAKASQDNSRKKVCTIFFGKLPLIFLNL